MLEPAGVEAVADAVAGVERPNPAVRPSAATGQMAATGADPGGAATPNATNKPIQAGSSMPKPPATAGTSITAANIGANVRLRQRSELRTESDRAESIQRILDDQLSSLDGIGDIAKASIAFKNLMDTKLKIQEREDKIFGLNEKDDGDESSSIEVEFVTVK